MKGNELQGVACHCTIMLINLERRFLVQQVWGKKMKP